MSVTANINYTDPNGFTYDPNKIEVTNGFACLTDQFALLGPEKLIGFRIDDVTTDSIAFSDSPAVLSFQNSPVVEYTALGADLTGAVTNRRLVINGSGNLDQLGSTGTIIFRFTPNYTNTPAQDCPIFIASDSSNFTSSGTNAIFLEHRTTGNINLRVKGGSSNIVNNVDLDFFSAVSNATYVFQLNLDVTTGNTELFINGVQFGPTLTNTGVRNGANYHALGAEQSGRPNCFIKDFMAFDTVKSIFPNDYFVPTQPYVTDDPILELNTTFNADALLSFTDSVIGQLPPNTDIRYSIVVNGIPNYWDGSSWTTSNLTYAQTNSATDVNINANALNISTGVQLGLRMLMRSLDGLATPCIDQTQLTYNLVAPPSGVVVCSVTFETTDIFGKPINNVKIIAETEQQTQVNNNALILGSSDGRTNYAGTAIIDIVEGASTNNTTRITFEYLDQGVVVQKVFTGIVIPDQSTANFVDLI